MRRNLSALAEQSKVQIIMAYPETNSEFQCGCLIIRIIHDCKTSEDINEIIKEECTNREWHTREGMKCQNFLCEIDNALLNQQSINMEIN